MTQADSKSEWQQWFDRVWEHREEVLYPSLFGETCRGIFPVQVEMLTGVFKQETFDPRWLHYGVVEFAPTGARRSWLYVTSGMSNDWDAERIDGTTPSGLGYEVVFQTTEPSEWPIIRFVHLMAFQLL